MDPRTVRELSEIERKTLAVLGNTPFSEVEIASKSGLNVDAVRRAVNWLAEKGLAKITETKEMWFVLSPEGEKALKSGLPEKRMLDALLKYGEMTFQDLKKKANLADDEFGAALGANKRKAFVTLRKSEVENVVAPTSVAGASAYRNEQEALKEIAETGNTEYAGHYMEFHARGLLSKRDEIRRKITITTYGKEAVSSPEFMQQRAYNINDPVPEVFGGKKQPYIQFLNIIRRKLTELGFVEMEAPLIVHEFYNFDVLFQPQNHPARTWTDTYQLKNPMRGKLTDRSKIAAVKAAHETGGVSASSGWGYTWLEEIAEKVMPTAHGTAHSASQLTKGVRVPGKYFAIARCFRPDVLDATHLIEFNQTDGFIVGEDLNFRHLLGMLEQFAKEVAGAEKVKFLPDYYPFTEPSVQLSAKHPQLGWVELGGAGMFRPEILENLGIKGQAIAWGIGIDRLAMFKLGIKDIRYLFSDDLNWLRRMPLVMEAGTAVKR